MKLNRGPVLLLAVGAAVVLILAVVIIVYMRDGRSTQQGEDSRPTARQVERQPFASEDEHVGEKERAEAADLETTEPESASEAAEGNGATSEAAEEIEPTGYSIAGHVVDENGAGIAAAEVQVLDGSLDRRWGLPILRRLETDETGSFSGKDLPRRSLYLRAGKEGYYFCRRGYEQWMHATGLHPVTYSRERDEVTGITLVLRPGLRIAGRVIDEKGEPVAGATVRVQGPGEGGPFEADEQGAFAITGLSPGEYRLVPEAKGFVTPSKYRRDRYNRQRFSAGEQGVVLQLERGIVLEGSVVVAETGEPAPHAGVVCVRQRTDPEDEDPAEMQSDEEGRFSVSVSLQEKTTLYAHWQNTVSSNEVVIDPTQGSVPYSVVLELVEAGSISGTVLDEETREPVEEARVETAVQVPWRWVTSTSDEAGAFRLVGLRAGRYFIGAYSEKHKRLEERAEIDVVEGKETTGVEILVVARVHDAISGRVVDAQGEPVAAVLVQPLISHLLFTRHEWGTLSDAEGKFTVRSSRTPVLGLLATHRDYIPSCVPVDESESDKNGGAAIEIVLTQGGASIEGTVRDSEGVPRRDMTVVLHGAQGIVPPEGAERGVTFKLTADVTDEQGDFRFKNLAEGIYKVSTTFAGIEHTTSEIDVEAGQPVTGVELTLMRPGCIAGKVTTPDGTPIDGISVCVEPLGDNPQWRTATDIEGNFRVENLLDGEQCYVYPDLEQEQPYLYAGGRRTTRVTCPNEHVDLVLEPVQCGALELIVYGRRDGAPVTHFDVDLEPHDGEGRGRSAQAMSAEGRVELQNVCCGTYVIHIRAPRFVNAASDPITIRAGQTTTHTAYIDESALIKGVVVRASDKSPVNPFRLFLENEEGRGIEPYDGRQFSNTDGSFECTDNIGPGTYRIAIGPEGLPVVKTEPFEVVAGAESVHRIEIPDGVTLKGRVVNGSGQAVAEAAVELRIHWGEKRMKPREATTDQRGAFVITGLPVGQGDIEVTHRNYAKLIVEELMITNDPPMEELVLTLDEGGRVFGRVTRRAGNAARSTVALRRLGGPDRLQTDADEDGEFEFPYVAPGTYSAILRGTNASYSPIQVIKGQEHEVNFDLASAGSLSGKIRFVPLSEGEAQFDVNLDRHDPTAGQAYWTPAEADVEEDGSYTMDQLLPGTYLLEVGVYRDGRRVQVTTVPKQVFVVISENSDATANVTVFEQPER